MTTTDAKTLCERRNELVMEGSCRSAYITRLYYLEKADWDNVTDEQLTRQHIPREVLPMLKEIKQQPANDKEREEAELKILLTSLSKRIKRTPGPHIPDTVWKEACSSEPEEWPNLREDEYYALEALSDGDLLPEEMVFIIGEYLARNHTKRQLEHWPDVMFGGTASMT